MKLGYLGPIGTFSYAAFLKTSERFPSYVGVPVSSIPLLFEAYLSGQLDSILVPVENSLEGPVSATMDALVTLTKGSVVWESELPVHHSLMGFDGAISHIHSHVQPLAQCAKFLQAHYPLAEQVSTLSTAKAAEEVVALGVSHAVIGHDVLSSLYPLKILARNIEDSDQNTTRFFLISDSQTSITGNDSTSIVFSTPQDVPGSLCDVLSIFSSHGINLSKINSRPAKTQLGAYLFFVDCDGHYLDDRLGPVLTYVSQKTSFYKWLGSYSKGEV